MVISDCLVACDASHVYIYIYIACFFLRVVEIFVLISAITHPNTNLHSQENKGSWNQIPTQPAKGKQRGPHRVPTPKRRGISTSRIDPFTSTWSFLELPWWRLECLRQDGVFQQGWHDQNPQKEVILEGKKKGPRLFPGNLGWQEKLNLWSEDDKTWRCKAASFFFRFFCLKARIQWWFFGRQVAANRKLPVCCRCSVGQK